MENMREREKVCVCERECVCVSVCERESMCVCARERLWKLRWILKLILDAK